MAMPALIGRRLFLVGLLLQLAVAEDLPPIEVDDPKVVEEPHPVDQTGVPTTPAPTQSIDEKVNGLRAQLMAHTMSGDFEKANAVLEELKKHTPTRAPTHYPTVYEAYKMHWWEMDVASASQAKMPLPCVVGPWAPWWPCSKSCGTGLTSRSRALIHDSINGGKPCPSLSEERNCDEAPHCYGDEPPPVDVDCSVGEWESWSSCSRTCGTGIQRRTRPVITEANLAGKACPELGESSDCHLADCPIPVYPTPAPTQFEGLNEDGSITLIGYGTIPAQDLAKTNSDRSVTVTSFTTGEKMTIRAGQKADLFLRLRRSYSIHHYLAGAKRSHEVNINPDVVRDCVAGDWMSWSPCSQTCGHGYQTRSRTVTIEPVNGGAACPSLLQSDTCVKAVCPIPHETTAPVDCEVGSWAAWSTCSTTCGHGTKFRTRPVTMEPYSGGGPCGRTFESAVCFSELCPDDLTTLAAASEKPGAACSRTETCGTDEFCVYTPGALHGACKGCIRKPMNCYHDLTTPQHVWTAESCEAQCGTTTPKNIFCNPQEMNAERGHIFKGSAKSEPTLRDVEDEFDRFGYHHSPMTVEVAEKLIWDLLDFHPEDRYLCHLLANFDKYAMDFHIDGSRHFTANMFHASILGEETVTAPPLQMDENHTVHSPIIPNNVTNDQVEASKEGGKAPVQKPEKPELAEPPVHPTHPPTNAPTLTPTSVPSSVPTYKSIDCAVGDWGEFGSCSHSCGRGVMKRSRTIAARPLYGGSACPELQDFQDCIHPCPIKDCEFTWKAWRPCSTTCGFGMQTRVAVIVKAAADCPVREDRTCYLGACVPPHTSAPTFHPTTQPSKSPTHQVVDCGWSTWSDWSTCSQPCGGGIRSKSRTMIRPPRYGGKACGAQYLEENCNTQACSAECEHVFGTWSACSRTCGGGSQQRSLEVVRDPANGGAPCPSEQERVCSTQSCPLEDLETPTHLPTSAPTRSPSAAPTMPDPVDCVVGTWSMWTDCSVNCGMGVQTRERSVLVLPEYNGKKCPTDLRQGQGCAGETCTNVCDHEWADWESCSASCGVGVQMRFAVKSSEGCSNNREDRACSTHACPTQAPTAAPTFATPAPSNAPTASPSTAAPVVDCQVGDWEPWSKCSAPCGTGIHMRMRRKTAWPKGGGALCPSLIEGSNCNTQPCPMDCEHTWLPWTACSKSCGQGVQTRGYTVQVHGGYGGKLCPSEEDRMCNTEPCSITMFPTPEPTEPPTAPPTFGPTEGPTFEQPPPVDCEVGDWGDWTQCSERCNSGVHSRQRSKVSSNKHGGRPCPALYEAENCNNHPCASVCEFDWGEWSACTKTCGYGVQARFATVTQPDGDHCPDREERICAAVPCPTDSPTTSPTQSPTFAVTPAPTKKAPITCAKASCNVPCPEAEEHCCSDFVDAMGMCNACISRSCPTPRPTTAPTPEPPSCEPTTCTVCEAGRAACCNAFVHAFNMCAMCSADACPVAPVTQAPTSTPTHAPTFAPTAHPTLMPTSLPTGHPTIELIATEHSCAEDSCTVCEAAQDICCSDFVDATGMCGNCVSHFCAPTQAPTTGAPTAAPSLHPTKAAVDCVAGDWGAWSLCSEPCGSGVRSRQRDIIQNNLYGGASCPRLVEGENCNTQDCPVDCEHEWEPWGRCSATCGGGIRTRSFTIIKNPTHGGAPCPMEEQQVCNTETCPPEDCVEGDWSDWGSCTVNCGSGVHNRTRTPVIPPMHGGAVCGASVEQRTCNTQECPVDCGFSDWGACTLSCGGGVQYRHPSIVHEECAPEEERTCNTEVCITPSPTPPSSSPTASPTPVPTLSPTPLVHCAVSDWTNSSQCSVACGNGVQMMTRTVTQEPSAGGDACPRLEDQHDCNNGQCGCIHEWGTWSACSKSCDGGIQFRQGIVVGHRNPDGTEVEDCPEKEERVCNTAACPTPAPTSVPTTLAPTKAPTIIHSPHCVDQCPSCCHNEDDGGLHKYCDSEDEFQRRYARHTCMKSCGVCVKLTGPPTDAPTPAPTIAPTVPQAGCASNNGRTLPHGYEGAGDGIDYCNRCKCWDGLLQCTHRQCGEPTNLPEEAKPCVALTCKNEPEYDPESHAKLDVIRVIHSNGDSNGAHHCSYNKYTEQCACWCWGTKLPQTRLTVGNYRMGGTDGFTTAVCEDVQYHRPYDVATGRVDVVISIGHEVVTPIQQWYRHSQMSVEFHGERVYQRRGIEHDAMTAWVESSDRFGFRACAEVDENFWHNGVQTSQHLDLSYFAAPRERLWSTGRSKAQSGNIGIMTPTWHAEGAACKIVNYNTPYEGAPIVLGSVQQQAHGNTASVAHWIENVNNVYFRVCFEAFGKYNNSNWQGSADQHSKLAKFSSFNFTWLAFELPEEQTSSSGTLEAAGTARAENDWLPYEHDIHPSDTSIRATSTRITCQRVWYNKTFISEPTVLVTANHKGVTNQDWGTNTSRPYLVTYVDQLYLDSFRVCSVMVGQTPTDGLLRWDWAAFGELVPAGAGAAAAEPELDS